jgi:hypothetical protein
MGTRITVVLLNYKRPDNLKLVIDSVHKQSVHPQIFLWNNGSSFNDSRITWQVDSSLNKICWPRWFMASMATTEYVCSLDDDMSFADNTVLQDAIDYADNHARDRIVGPYGVRLMARRTYMKSDHIDLPETDTNVDIVKGRMMLFRRELLQHVPTVVPEVGEENPIRNDDIVLSGLIARGKPGFHRVPALFKNRILPHAEDGCGLVQQAEHWESRNRTKEEFFGRNGLRLWVRLCADRIKRRKGSATPEPKLAVAHKTKSQAQRRISRPIKTEG